MSKYLKILSLFDGISACQVALKNLGIEYDYFASEIDKYAIQVTQKNFPNTIQLGDVKDIYTDYTNGTWQILRWGESGDMKYTSSMPPSHKVSEFDLLCGGSPCQDLSIAKKDRKGLDGERSGLFFEYVRILNEVKPKFFILENVASMSKEAKQEITSHLYGIEPIIINSSLLTAQQRKRVYFVGVLQTDGTYKKVEIEQPEDKGILLKDILESETNLKDYKSESIAFTNKNQNKNSLRYVGRINGRDWAKNGKSLSRNAPQGDRIYSVQGKSVCLSANGGGRGAKTGLYQVPNDIVKFNENQQKKYDAMQVDCDKAGCLTEAIGRGGSSSEFISSCKKKTLAFNELHKIDLPDGDYQIRKLTPNECARLQGFPDGFCDGISNTQAYKCYGNSFTVPVIEHILKTILK